MPVKIFVNINDPRWNRIKIDFAKIVRIAVAGARGTNKKIKKNAEVSIVLTNDSKIRELNKKYRGMDKATNVLSFETGDPELLGDIYISFDTTKKESTDVSFINHTTHLVVHGVLHLLGYDHLNDSDADIMEDLEVKILAKLGIANPYADEVSENGEWRAESGDKCKFRKELFQSSLFFLFCSGISALGFAPFHFWWATVLGIGGAYYLTAKQSNESSKFKVQSSNSDKKKSHFEFCKLNIACAVCFGAGYALANFWWVTNSIFVVPELATQFAILTIPALIGIAIFGGIIFGLPFLSIGCMRRWGLSTAIRPFVFAASWTIVLWLREWLLTGFPWNPIANISMPFPALANSMSLWGALGLTFIIIGLIASMVECITHKAKGRWFSLIIFTILLSIGIQQGWKNIVITRYIEDLTERAAGLRMPIIRIVQPAWSAEQKATHSRQQAIDNAEENIKNLKMLSDGDFAVDNSDSQDGRPRPDLIVFPETSYPYAVVQGVDDFPFAREIGKPIIIGATSATDLNGAPRFYNSMIIANSDGKIEKIYSKSHLVPFGEYRPLGDIIPTPGQLTAGDGAEIIELAISNEQLAIVPAICYEIIFSDSLVPHKKSTEHRVQSTDVGMIINITNDTWFGKTPGTYQHLDMVRRYAIESGLPIIRANYSGISAFISADGRIIKSLPIGVSGVLDGSVAGAHMTPYRKIGRDFIMAIILIFSIICVFVLKEKRNK